MFPTNSTLGGTSIGVTANGMSKNNMAQPNNPKSIRKNAVVKIVEQPASKALRFRYECEGRSAGSIPGINSTAQNKTFPTIEIIGYTGPAVVVVSCVTKDPPYRPHPHNLVGKDGCKKGVCTIEIKQEAMRAVFSNLGIQCVKKKDIETALRAREEIRVDPFKTGFGHKDQLSSIDLNSVRLCFQVFLDYEKKGNFTLPLTPVLSNPIYDKKTTCDLLINSLCSCSSTVAGGKEIILLCEKVAKQDIVVRFFEELNGQIIWEAYGDFQHSDVFKQTAIAFKTPKYRTLQIEQTIKVNIQLKRPSDGRTSEALPFHYLPLHSDPELLQKKRKFTNNELNISSEHHQQEKQQNIQLTKLQNNPSTLELNWNNKAEQNEIHANLYVGNGPNQYNTTNFLQSTQPSFPEYNTVYNIPSPYDNSRQYQPQQLMSPNHQYVGNVNPSVGGLTQQLYHQQQQHHQNVNSSNHFNSIQSSRTTLAAQLTHKSNNIQFDANISNTHASVQQQQQHQLNQHLHLIRKNNLASASYQNNFNTNKLNNFNMQGHHIFNTNTNINFNTNQNIQQQQVNRNNPINNLTNNVDNAAESSLLEMDSEQLMQLTSAELFVLSIK